MRWSWTSFAAGMFVAAALALLAWIALVDPSAPAARVVPTDWLAPTDGSVAASDHDRDVDVDDVIGADDVAVGPVSDAPTTERPTSRARVTRRPVVSGTPGPPSTGGGGSIAIGADGNVINLNGSSFSFGSAGAMSFRIVTGKDGRIQLISNSPGDASRALLDWAKERAAEVFPAEDAVTHDDARSRLDARSISERALGLGLALRTDPPSIDLLVRAAQDTAYPDLQATALRAAAGVAIDDPRVQAALLDGLSASAPAVRLTSTEFVGQLGEQGARRASEILLSGDYTSAVLDRLAAAVAASRSVATFLGSSPPPDAALSVVQHVAKRVSRAKSATEGGDADNDAEREADRRLAQLLPEFVRPLLDAPEAEQHAALVLPQLAALGHGAFLRSVASTSQHRPTVRSAAVAAALGNETTRADGVAAAAAVLTDPTAPVSLITTVLGAVTDEQFADPVLRGALSAAARTHPSAWARDAAATRLARVDPTSIGTLVIHEAVYGASGGYVDCAVELRGAISEGALRIQVGNDLAGDPKPGIHKQLRVEYSVGGVRRLRSVGEGGWLQLP